MATPKRAGETPTPERSARAGRKRGWLSWHSPLTQVVKGGLYRIGGRSELPAGYRYKTEWLIAHEFQDSWGAEMALALLALIRYLKPQSRIFQVLDFKEQLKK